MIPIDDGGEDEDNTRKENECVMRKIKR